MNDPWDIQTDSHLSWFCFILLWVVLGVGWGEAYLLMLRVYTRCCAQGSLLAVHGGSYDILGIESGMATYKANILLAVLLLRPPGRPTLHKAETKANAPFPHYYAPVSLERLSKYFLQVRLATKMGESSRRSALHGAEGSHLLVLMFTPVSVLGSLLPICQRSFLVVFGPYR